MVSFTRSMFHAAFKTNPYLERAIMTGITRISKESIFSDLNNLEAVTTTSRKYEDCFGFTEEEVFDVLEEFGLSDRKQEIKNWFVSAASAYHGFVLGLMVELLGRYAITSNRESGFGRYDVMLEPLQPAEMME